MQPVNNLPNLPKWLNIGLAFPVILLNGWLLIQFKLIEFLSVSDPSLKAQAKTF